MYGFRRFTRSVSAQIEILLTQIENQEASVSAAIHGLERGVERVRVQRLASERSVSQLRKELAQTQNDSLTWKRRALGLRADRESALECLRRMQQADARAQELAQRLQNEERTQQQIVADQRAIEQQLIELRQRRSQLISREARAEASACGDQSEDIALVFERWQARIEQREGTNPNSGSPPDSFAARFDEQEQADRLNQTLDRLFAEQEP